MQWFKLYPQFLSNPFYISGESYAGVYVPTLASNVVKGTNFKLHVIPIPHWIEISDLNLIQAEMYYSSPIVIPLFWEHVRTTDSIRLGWASEKNYLDALFHGFTYGCDASFLSYDH